MFATPELRRFKTSDLHRFATPELRRFKIFASSRLRSFVGSRFQIFASSRLRGFAGSRFLKTHFTNFIKPDVSRVTGFPEFPNNRLEKLMQRDETKDKTINSRCI
jgi:hypothetical protein